jgi:hypothetical protein
MSHTQGEQLHHKHDEKSFHPQCVRVRYIYVHVQMNACGVCICASIYDVDIGGYVRIPTHKYVCFAELRCVPTDQHTHKATEFVLLYGNALDRGNGSSAESESKLCYHDTHK